MFFKLDKAYKLCDSNCFSCKFRKPIDFVEAARVDKKARDLKEAINKHNALPWYKRIFRFHPDPSSFITKMQWIQERFERTVLNPICRLNPKHEIKGNLDVCSHYEDRWPCGVHKNPLSMEDEITDLEDYINYMMETENKNG